MPTRPILALILPDGVLVLGVLAAALWPDARQATADVLPYFRYGILALAVLLAWRFDQGRILLALLALTLADRGFALMSGASIPSLVAVATALAFVVAAIGGGPGILARLTGIKLVGILGVAAATYLVARNDATALPWLVQPAVPVAWTSLSVAAAFVVVACAAVLVTRFVARRHSLDRGLLWALVATTAALHFPAGSTGAGLLFGTAGLVLVVAMVEDAYALAYRDGLTGLPSRRAFDRALKRLRSRYTVAMADVDRFKRFNDDHGHDVGDQVLRLVATRLRRTGGGARVYRYGGEEFAMLFPHKSAEEVLPHLEAARATVEAAQFTLRGRDRPRRRPRRPKPRTRKSRTLAVTVSIGVAYAADNHTTPHSVMEQADQALYRAKKNGRNRVSVDR